MRKIHGFFVAWVLLSACSYVFAQQITLIENGRPLAHIVVGDKAAPDEREAAEELAAYIHKTTGGKIPIGPGNERSMTRILVGPGACPASVQQEIGKLEYEGYVIRTEPDGSLILAGNGGSGTFYAVATFLERFVGIRWLWPGETGEVVPSLKSLRLETPIDIRREPAYLWRSLDVGGAVWGPLDKIGAQRKIGVLEENIRLQRLWEKRSGFGGVRVYGGHAFGEILPPAKYGPTHPEYYALVKGVRAEGWEKFNGKHGMQPCTTNPDVVRITIEYCNNFFDSHPDYHAIFISPNDGGGFCECDRCRSLDTGTTQARPGLGGGEPRIERVMTDRMLTFANQVAEGVARKHPGKKLVIWAYAYYKQPPTRLRPAPNLIISYCLQAAKHWDAEIERADYEVLAGWSRVTNNLGIYEYYRVADPDMPRFFPALIERSVRRLHQLGYRYYQAVNGDGYAVDGFNFYLLSRLLWDPSQSAAALKKDYVEKGFGDAAPAISRYFDRMADQWQKIQGKGVSMEQLTLAEYENLSESYLTRELRRAARQDLDEAQRLATGKCRDRVEFINQGLRYVELTMDAVDKTIPLLRAGWVLKKPRAIAPENPDMRALQTARLAWEAREAFIDRVKDDFVLSMWFVRYNDTFRSFNPIKSMRTHQ